MSSFKSDCLNVTSRTTSGGDFPSFLFYIYIPVSPRQVYRFAQNYTAQSIKANQRTLRYGIEDKVELAEPAGVHSEDPCLAHGRIETRTCRIFRGEDLVADKEKWNGRLTVIEIRTSTERKSDNRKSDERRFYVSSFNGSAGQLGWIARRHWAIESMHWDLDCYLKQDFIKRKSPRAARNLDTIQRIVLSILSIWKGRRRKLSDKSKGTAELIRELSMSFTCMMRMLTQK